MKLLLFLLAGVSLLSGCCSSKPCDGICHPTNEVVIPTNSPIVTDIDGTQNYPATEGGDASTWVITLPHGTDVTRIRTVSMWVNTKGLTGRRLDNKVYCDEILILNDDQAHTLIKSSPMFWTFVNQSTTDVTYDTEGVARGNGDILDFKESDGAQFEQIRGTVSRGRIYIRLKNNQPRPSAPKVLSAKVAIGF